MGFWGAMIMSFWGTVFAVAGIVHRAERTTGEFTRTFTLPFHVDPDGVKATFKYGVLTLDLPRPESERPKRIKVQPS